METGQPDSQFYMENHNENWYLYNYKKDVEIDNYITSNYNQLAADIDANEPDEPISMKYAAREDLSV